MVRRVSCRAMLVSLLMSSAQAVFRNVTLLPESSLATDCYEFPKKSFSRSNCVKCSFGSSPHIPVAVGESVPDFTLSGTSLSSLLTTGKPVVLVWGMWTCPAFRGLAGSKPMDECSYRHEYDLIETYSDRVTFIHLMGPEPHPITPDVNFDSGKTLMNYWSTVSQPRTWAERSALALRVAPLLHPNVIFLVDTFKDNPNDPRNSPVWCSLGQSARSSLLIDPSGVLRFSQTWFHAGEMAAMLDFILRSYSENSGQAATYLT